MTLMSGKLFLSAVCSQFLQKQAQVNYTCRFWYNKMVPVEAKLSIVSSFIEHNHHETLNPMVQAYV